MKNDYDVVEVTSKDGEQICFHYSDISVKKKFCDRIGDCEQCPLCTVIVGNINICAFVALKLLRELQSLVNDLEKDRISFDHAAKEVSRLEAKYRIRKGGLGIYSPSGKSPSKVII